MSCWGTRKTHFCFGTTPNRQPAESPRHPVWGTRVGRSEVADQRKNAHLGRTGTPAAADAGPSLFSKKVWKASCEIHTSDRIAPPSSLEPDMWYSQPSGRFSRKSMSSVSLQYDSALMPAPGAPSLRMGQTSHFAHSALHWLLR